MGKDSAARIELLDYLHVIMHNLQYCYYNSKYMHMGCQSRLSAQCFLVPFITDFFLLIFFSVVMEMKA